MKRIIITQDTVFEPEQILDAQIIVQASGITIDGAGATLVGPATPGDRESYESAGPGIFAEGCSNVTLKNIKASGFETGLRLKDCTGWVVENCDFSNNYTNPDFGWGELPARGGIVLVGVRASIFRGNKANNVWDGVNLTNCDDNEFVENDFSHCSNVCAKLWTSCRNRFIKNNLSYGLRIDRSIGEVHARDSAGVLIESGSNDNYFYGNDITYGGDGVFIRVLNGWISTGNVFIENDTSYGNNNCVESWSPRNIFIRNKANHGSYGFWMGGSDQTVLIGNECAFNGMEEEHQNAPVTEEIGFAGIIFLGGTGSHTIIEGNYCHDNNGSGIALQGNVRTGRCSIHHMIVQKNRLERNKRPYYIEQADWVFISQNESKDNLDEPIIRNVTRMTKPESEVGIACSPVAKISAPEIARVGQEVVFDASASSDPSGSKLTFEWDLDEAVFNAPRVAYTFKRPGFHRVGLTVSNGSLSALAWRDLVVADETFDEIGTEYQSCEWRIQSDSSSAGTIALSDDADAIIGSYSLKLAIEKYTGENVRLSYPLPNGGMDISDKSKLVFWLRVRTPDIPVENADNGTARIKLISDSGEITFSIPLYNLCFGVYSEARWTWSRIEIPTASETDLWKRETVGEPDMKHINTLTFEISKSGPTSFTAWLDGIKFE